MVFRQAPSLESSAPSSSEVTTGDFRVALRVPNCSVPLHGSLPRVDSSFKIFPALNGVNGLQRAVKCQQHGLFCFTGTESRQSDTCVTRYNHCFPA